MVQKLDLFPSLGEAKETPTLLGALERVTEVSSFYRINQIQFPKGCVF
jgi:hypothetical protein